MGFRANFEEADLEAEIPELKSETSFLIQEWQGGHHNRLFQSPEGPSVEEVRKFVDSVVGPYSKNEYFSSSHHAVHFAEIKFRSFD